jgi:protein AFG1
MRGGATAARRLRRAPATSLLRRNGIHTSQTFRSATSSTRSQTTHETEQQKYWRRSIRLQRLPAQSGRAPARHLATVVDSKPDNGGPLEEYDRRVEEGLLRNDEHQRGKLLSSAAVVI